MNHYVKCGGYALLLSLAALSVGGCSDGGPASPSKDLGVGEFDETTGALVAHLQRIPDNVRCLEIQVSDWRFGLMRFDVTPGDDAFIKIAPLLPGWVYFYGSAYSVACADIYGPNDGGPYGFQTWYADYASAEIVPGRATPVSLTFRKLGAADVSIDFSDEPPCDGGTCPPSGDAGFAR